MNLLVVIPYHTKDAPLVKSLLEWMGELIVEFAPVNEAAPHSCLLAADASVPQDTRSAIKNQAQGLFHSAVTMVVPTPETHAGWPKGPNFMFHEVSRQVLENYKLPFLWLEPDSVPMRPQWLSLLANEYALCPKKFMGTVNNVTIEGNLPIRHMPGVAIYPQDAHHRMKEFCAGTDAFDYASAAYVIPRMSETKLIHQIWGNHEQQPTFCITKTPESPASAVPISAIPREAVLFHRSKDGTLIKLLREGRALQAEAQKVHSEALKPEGSFIQSDGSSAMTPGVAAKRRGRPPKE